MTDLTIIHLSDLHYSRTKAKDIEIVLGALWSDLRARCAETPPAMLVFSGDLVQAGNDASFHDVSAAFLDPLLECTGLTPERLFVSPGNHDIDITRVDEIVERGLQQQLVDRDAVNRLLDKQSRDGLQFHFDRLVPFIKFRSGYGLQQANVCSGIGTTTILELGPLRIGIACLNSAWRATGAPNNEDRRRLMIGERQIDEAAKALSEATYRIAVFHHPTDWFAEFDEIDTSNRLQKEFDLVLTGHNHRSFPSAVQRATGTAVFNASGCLFGSRDYFNGYALIRISPENGTVTVSVREYFDERRAFDKAVRGASDGLHVFRSGQGEERALSLASVADQNRLVMALGEMATALFFEGEARTGTRRTLEELFVAPRIGSQPEEQCAAGPRRRTAALVPNAPPFETVEELLARDTNLLLLGGPESGKTTLLYYIGTLTTSPQPGAPLRLPFYVDFRELRRGGKKPVLRQLKRTMAEVDAIGRLDGYLAAGQCLLLVDDVNLDDGAGLKHLLDFSVAFPGTRIVATMDQDLASRLRPGADVPELGPSFLRRFVYSFGRRQVIDLVKRWHSGSAADTAAIAGTVLASLGAMRVPRTPFAVSLLLSVMQKDACYRPTNRVALVEQAIEGLLDKGSPDAGRRDQLDYRNREHFLAYLAARMVERGEYWFSRFDLERETLQYFEKMGFSHSIHPFITFLLQRGVLFQVDEAVSFKFRCFCEYFIARQMREDSGFRAKLLSEETYLQFTDEIDFYTGMERTNRDLVETLQERTQAAFRSLGSALKPEAFESMSLGPSVLDAAEEESLRAGVRGATLEESAREELLEDAEWTGRLPAQRIERRSPREPAGTWLGALSVFSRTVRNCELIDDAGFKEEATRLCLWHWSVAVLYFLQMLDEETARRSVAEEEAEKISAEELRYIGRIVVPLVVSGLAKEWLVSEKLGFALRRILDDSGTPLLVRFLASCMSFDMGLPAALEDLREYVKTCENHRYGLELAFYRLYVMYVMGQLPAAKRQAAENLVADIARSVNRSGIGANGNWECNRLIAGMRKALLLQRSAEGVG